VTARAALRPAGIAAAWGAATLTAIVVLGLAIGTVLGHRSFTVMSGSMEPAISTGDIVVTSQISPSQARVGQVVSFRDPTGSKRLITHRVRRIRNDGRSYRFSTKGDANSTLERWTVPADGKIGRVWLRIPKLGYLLAQTRRPVGRIVMVVIPALLLALLELAHIWGPARRRPGTAGGGNVALGQRRPVFEPRRELTDDEWLDAWERLAAPGLKSA
jgi:signal peptidase I